MMCLCGKADLDNPLHRCLWICMAYQRELNEKVVQLSVPPETRTSRQATWIPPSEESMGKGDEGIHGCPGCHVGSLLWQCVLRYEVRSQSIWHYACHSIRHDALIWVWHSQMCLPNFCWQYVNQHQGPSW
jgi:hypothetical protein